MPGFDDKLLTQIADGTGSLCRVVFYHFGCGCVEVQSNSGCWEHGDETGFGFASTKAKTADDAMRQMLELLDEKKE